MRGENRVFHDEQDIGELVVVVTDRIMFAYPHMSAHNAYQHSTYLYYKPIKGHPNKHDV